jgi:putative heme degradation protein
MDIGKEFGTDLKKEEDGVPVELGDSTFFIARANTKAYNKMVNQLFTKNKKVLDLKNDAATTLSDNLMAEVVGTTVLKGWTGVTEGGVDLPYSVLNAIRMCRIKDFRAIIMEKASDMTLYKSAVDEEVTGN